MLVALEALEAASASAASKADVATASAQLAAEKRAAAFPEEVSD